MNTRKAGVLAFFAAAALALAACTAGMIESATESSPPATTAPESPSTPASPPAKSPTADPAPNCSGLSGSEALDRWINDVPANPVQTNGGVNGWDRDYAVSGAAQTYDECATLSWITLFTYGGTVSSPQYTMLFAHGVYIGTSTDESYAYGAEVTRLADDVLEFAYIYPKDGECNACATGRAVSVYRWDADAREAVREGELPPYYPGDD